MKVLVVGGQGLIGAALGRVLAGRGHTVVTSVRGEAGGAGLRLDYTRMPGREELAAMLSGMDAVVNAVGIFQEKGNQTFDSLHVKGPARLFEAAVDARIHKLVHLSALGADAASPFPYLASKGRADALIGNPPLAVSIVRPSLVFSEHGQSTKLFARFAALPVTPLPEDGGQLIQPIVLDDLLEAIARLLESDSPPALINAVGRRALTFKQYLSLFRRSFGRTDRFVSMPASLLRLLLPVTEKWPALGTGSRDAWGMLRAGNVASSGPLTRVLGREPRDPQDYVAEAGPRLLPGATTPWLVVLLRVALATMWVGTAWVSVFGYPLASSLEMLGRVGLTGVLAYVALYTGAGLDLLLGLATLCARHRRPFYLLQLVLVVAYSAIISVWLPEQWLHPFGPVLKNIPIVAAIITLYYLDDPRWI